MNNLSETDQRHIQIIKSQLTRKYGDLIDRIYCYGSRVEKQTQDTDFDVLIITREKIDWRKEDEISYVLYLYGLENDLLFDTMYFSAEEFDIKYPYMPLIENVRRTGVLI